MMKKQGLGPIMWLALVAIVVVQSIDATVLFHNRGNLNGWDAITQVMQTNHK